MLLETKQDTRGVLYEAFSVEAGQVFVVIINPGFTRGNHYHKRKTEKFIVVSGSATISLRNRKNNACKSYRVTAGRPKLVTVYPWTVHNVMSKLGCVLLCWASEKLNDNDTDTYSEEV